LPVLVVGNFIDQPVEQGFKAPAFFPMQFNQPTRHRPDKPGEAFLQFLAIGGG